MTYHAFPVQLAKEAILLGKYTDAINILKIALPSQITPDLQFLCAYLHFWDDDLSRLDAIDIMQTIAEQGHAEACYVMAVCPEMRFPYEFRLPQTIDQFEYLQRASDIDSIAGVTDLAECYLQGIFVPQNDYHVRQLLKRAYKRLSSEYAKTRYLYGKLCYEGRGGEVNAREGSIALWDAHKVSFIDAYVMQALLTGRQLARNFESEPAPKYWDELIEKLESKPDTQKGNLWQSYLYHYCKLTFAFDLRRTDFDTFCDFLFDHFPIEREHKNQHFNWKKNAKVKFFTYEVVEYYSALFSDPRFLQYTYSDEQIYFALDMLFSTEDWIIGNILTHHYAVPYDSVRKVYELFVHLFSQSAFKEIGFMWWDHDSHSVPRGLGCHRHRDGIIKGIFETQVKVLNTHSHANQWAAIHGLGHWRHPDKDKALQSYLDNNPNLPKKLRNYAIRAMGDTTHWL